MSIAFSGSILLLDIEGTTSSVRYVFDVLFPYAREHLADFLQRRGHEPEVRQVAEQVARDAGHASLADWLKVTEPLTRPDVSLALSPEHRLVAAECLRLMDADAKATGLKALQGLIWKEAYDAGRLESHVYDDVPEALVRWRITGRTVCIYSSGSIAAQQVFFAHTRWGSLLEHFAGHYDTTIGPKKEVASYQRIAADRGQDPREFLFLSDVPAELDAARAAGMQVALVLRPGNAPVPEDHGLPTIHAFDEIELVSAS